MIICGLLALILLAGGLITARDLFFPSHSATGGDSELLKDGQRLNVLLLGIDAREDEGMARSDSIILVSVDPKSKQVSLLSIPRDTRVNIPGHGWDKINSATVYGGPELSAKVLSSLLGVSVKHYILTDFSGFKDIVDVLGGVVLDVDQDMYEVLDGDRTDVINLTMGVQRLDGDKALQYVRYRKYDFADIDRTKYQQKFLIALVKEILQPSSIPKLPRLIPEINRYVKTNLSISDMLKMTTAAKSLESFNMVAQTLPGRPIELPDGDYWGVDPVEAEQAVAALFNGETVTNVVLQTPLTGQYAVPAETKKAPEKTAQDKAAAGTQADIPTGKDEEDEDTAISPVGPGQVSGDKAGSGGTATFTPVEPEPDAATDTTATEPPAGTKADTGSGSTVTTKEITEIYSPGKGFSDYGVFNKITQITLSNQQQRL